MNVLSVTPASALRYSVFIAGAFHFFGAIGMATPWRNWFISATPLNLLLSFALLLWCQKKPLSARFIIWAALAIFIGYFAEVIGVNTGLIFGTYQYGITLGPGWQQTPFMIGLIWLMTTWLINDTVYFLKPDWPSYINVIVSALACTFFDVLIEPVAIDLGFWTWAAGDPPLQNYLGWFGVSLLISIAYVVLVGRKQHNPFALYLLGMQAAFFWVLR